MSEPTFYWHDYETFGTDPQRDRPAQFAGQRTTLDLEPVGEPLSIFCKPARDILPQPISCLITGITPQVAERDGVIESQFAAQVNEQLAQPGTCGVGYNSLRFDDQFTRCLLYRNFYDPYAREWENGNSRWDIIDLVRMCYALRPQGIEWPRRDDDLPSFRLEDLSAANRLEHGRAHDALSDVQATIALARLLKSQQRRLFDWYFGLRRKQRAFDLLDYVQRKPVLHVSSRYPAERGCLAMIVPLAPLTVLAATDVSRIGLDVDRCLAHLQRIHGAPDLADKLRRVFDMPEDSAPVDVDLALYRGFAGDADRRLLREVRATPALELGARTFAFADRRHAELLFRYRARNWPHTLNPQEAAQWTSFCRTRLNTEHGDALSLDQYAAQLAALRAVETDQQRRALLDQLERWGDELATEMALNYSGTSG